MKELKDLVISILQERWQANIANYYNLDMSEEEKRCRNAVITEYETLIAKFKEELNKFLSTHSEEAQLSPSPDAELVSKLNKRRDKLVLQNAHHLRVEGFDLAIDLVKSHGNDSIRFAEWILNNAYPSVECWEVKKKREAVSSEQLYQEFLSSQPTTEKEIDVAQERMKDNDILPLF